MPEALSDVVLVLAAIAGLFGSGWLLKIVLAAARAAHDLDELGKKVNAAVSLATMGKDTADNNTARIIRLEEGDRHQWRPIREALTQLAQQVTTLAGQMSEWRERESRELGEITARLDGIESRMDRAERTTRRD